MENFFEKIKELFDKVPAKSKFLADIGFNHSYTGFRYFLQGHTERPSPKFMEKLSEEMGYSYIQIPIKSDPEHQEIISNLNDTFVEDLKIYLEKYEGDSKRTITRVRNGAGSVSTSIATFEVDQDLLDPDKQLDVSDLF